MGDLRGKANTGSFKVGGGGGERRRARAEGEGEGGLFPLSFRRGGVGAVGRRRRGGGGGIRLGGSRSGSFTFPFFSLLSHRRDP